MSGIFAVIKFFLVGLCLISMVGCLAANGSYPIPAPVPAPTSQPTGQQTGAPVAPAQAERLKRLMLPLLHVMDRPIPRAQAQISVVDDASLNAGSAGKGQFIVTTGLLNRANDVQLEAILAHEIAHDDLGHMAKAQTLGAGMNIASILLDQIFPGSGQIAPIVGNLAIRAYGRQDEYEADSHGVKLLRRLHPNGKEMMVSSLTWLEQVSGSSGGGFFSTHPMTGDRVERLRSMP